ncbi:glycosyltransferase [Seohaeicola nanhaiensis]|uniref:Glycosyltransferase n=1 Tax=Seohaeicola nanhaiensis TaxID=1387282 RepID=A0ABV9KHQ0_9RHOB
MGGVTFLDPMAPRAYTGGPGELEGLGGTEATLVRVSESLATAMPVTVRQSAWAREGERVNRAHWCGWSIDCRMDERPDVIVVINSWKIALKVARLHPDSRVIVWQHVFPGRHNRAHAAALPAADVEIVCVSSTHARWLCNFAGPGGPRISHIPNPIPDELAPDATERDRDLLIYASSPHKGLAQVFRRFDRLRSRFPTLRLAVADPGYLAWPTGPQPDGVVALGRLAQPELHRWMRRALCLFYPQDHFAETFGLVIAEANAVGCPALLHRGLGANDEVVSDPSQCIDTSDDDAIEERIREWRIARPGTTLAAARPEFRLSSIAVQWRAAIGAWAIPESSIST